MLRNRTEKYTRYSRAWKATLSRANFSSDRFCQLWTNVG